MKIPPHICRSLELDSHGARIVCNHYGILEGAKSKRMNDDGKSLS